MTSPGLISSQVIDYLSKLSPLWWLLVGGLLTQLWYRFRARARRITWRAWHSQIAVAGNHPQFGTITVQFNGTPVAHVHTTTIEITNESNEDHKDVLLTLRLRGAGTIVSSSGQIEGVFGVIPLDADYLALFNGATQAQRALLTTYVVHKVGVFNRRQKAIFNLLVVRNDANNPGVEVSCNHPGVKLAFAPTAGIFVDGVPLDLATGLGFLITVGIIALLAYRQSGYRHPYLLPFFAWFVGLVSNRIGAAAFNGWKALGRLLG